MDNQPTEKICEASTSKLERASIDAAIMLLETRLNEELLRAAACPTAIAILKAEA